MAARNRNRNVEIRRLRVARLLVRGYTEREIVAALAHDAEEGGLRNPETGEPYSQPTIHRDSVAVRKMWVESLKEELEDHRGRQVAELQEARRVAWREGDVEHIRKNIGLESDLLGTKELGDADLDVTFRIVYEDG